MLRQYGVLLNVKVGSIFAMTPYFNHHGMVNGYRRTDTVNLPQLIENLQINPPAISAVICFLDLPNQSNPITHWQ